MGREWHKLSIPANFGQLSTMASVVERENLFKINELEFISLA